MNERNEGERGKREGTRETRGTRRNEGNERNGGNERNEGKRWEREERRGGKDN